MRNSQLKRILLLLICLAIAGCATTLEVPLTADQQARATISRAQGQWNVWFDVAKTYYITHPEKQHEWKVMVVPAFQESKNELQIAALSLQAGTFDTGTIISIVERSLNSLLLTLIQMGVLK